MTVAAAALVLAGSWWALAIASWLRWERRFATAGRRRAVAEERASGQREWTAGDIVWFGMPMVLPIGLGLDGLLLGGILFYEPAWSFFSPWTSAIQGIGLVALSIALPLFSGAAYLTARHVYSKLPEERALMAAGPYRYIRHPIYLSFILIGTGLVLVAHTFLMLPVLGMVWYSDYRGEEAELARSFGAEYDAYRRRTGAFLPRFRKAP
jgi:protein-S-isoprenylcysteine O-methyltransferase Ste14